MATQVWLPAGPLTRDAPIQLLAADQVVVSTPFLDWQAVAAGVGAARSQLRLALSLRAFISRCKVGTLPADDVAARAADVFRARFTAAFWARVFDELAASGLFAVPITDLRDLDRRLEMITISNPVNLEIRAADWDLAPAFVIPPGAGAPAAARRALLGPARYLSLVSVATLQSSSPLGLQRFADLAGYLGGCSTMASREDEAGLPLSTAMELRAFCGADALSDGVRARAVPAALDRLRLPSLLRATSVSEDDLGLELADGIRYRSSAEARVAVTEQRILLLGIR